MRNNTKDIAEEEEQEDEANVSRKYDIKIIYKNK